MAQHPLDPIVTAVNDFQNSLNGTQQAELLAIHGATPPDANAVLAFTAEVDRTHQRRQSRCVASRLHGTLQSVQQFTDVVSTFVSSNPAIAALVWGSIRFTILAASNFTSFFDKLSEWFMKIRASCPRFSKYQYLYPDSKGLQGALCTYYATVIRFCTKAVQAIGRNGKSRRNTIFLELSPMPYLFPYSGSINSGIMSAAERPQGTLCVQNLCIDRMKIVWQLRSATLIQKQSTSGFASMVSQL